MTDIEIPKICRNCKNCERYIEIGVFMPSWTPWKWRCKVDKRPLLCENEENSLSAYKKEEVSDYEKTEKPTECSIADSNS